MKNPGPTRGMHHVALNVVDLVACEYFYVELLGMQVEWRPDEDTVYLTTGTDNLALHRSAQPIEGHQHLNHIGFVLNSPTEVNQWHAFLREQKVTLRTEPRTHRDGAHSFYCQDPDGNVVQMIYHPPLVKV